MASTENSALFRRRRLTRIGQPPGYEALDGSSGAGWSTGTVFMVLGAILIAALAIAAFGMALHRILNPLNPPPTLDTLQINTNLTVLGTTNTTGIITNMLANRILHHFSSAAIPPTHSMQTLANNASLPPVPGVPILQTAPLGVLTVGRTVGFGNIAFKPLRGGPWTIRDLAADDYTSVSDVAGTRVLQAGLPEVFGGDGLCDPDTQSPADSVTSSVELSSANFEGGRLTLSLRSGSELDFDYIRVFLNGIEKYVATGSGPAANNAFVEGTVVLDIKGTDIVLIEFRKDGSCWGGYDILYFHATLAPPTRLSMTIPENMSAYLGKDIQICSVDQGSHTLELTGGVRHFDPAAQWKVLQFQGNGVDACCVTLKFMSPDRVSVATRDACTIFCAENNRYHCVDPLRPEKTNALHGGWRTSLKALDHYPFVQVDASTYPVTVKFHVGTVNYPRSNPDIQFYYAISAGTYSSMNSTNIFSPFARDVPVVFSLQPGGAKLVNYYGNDDSESGIFGIFEKTPALPPQVPYETGTVTELPPDDPIAIFRNYFDAVIYEFYPAISKAYNNIHWIGFPAAKTLMETIIQTGTGPLVSTIVETRVTQACNPEGITEFRTQNYHHVSPVSRITVSGFIGACSSLNGNHLVAIPATTNIPVANPAYLDYSANANLRTMHHKVGVFLDSSSVPVFPGTTIANCTGSTPVITVSYGPITSSTNYINTIGAIQHWFYEAIKVGTGFTHFVYFSSTNTNLVSGIGRVAEDWSEITTQLAAGAVPNAFSSSLRKQVATKDYSSTSAFYNAASYMLYQRLYVSSRIQDRRVWQGKVDLTGQYGIRPDLELPSVVSSRDPLSATHWFNIARENYLDPATVKYPAWKFIGTTRLHPNNLLAQSAYPGGGGDEMDTVMVPFGTLPPTNYSYLSARTDPNGAFGTPYPFIRKYLNRIGQEMIYVGRLKTSLTGGVKIGYMRIADMGTYDVAGLSASSTACPTAFCNTSSFRNDYEGITSAFAKVMQYLLVDLECVHMILDARDNQGGSIQIPAVLRQFFGGTDGTFLLEKTFSPKDNGNGALVDGDQFTLANKAYQNTNELYYASPTLSKTNYPGSVLTNGELVLLVDSSASSTGDLLLPNIFLGPAYNGQLGNSTQVTMLGAVNSLIGSRASGTRSLPTSASSPLLKSTDGQIWSSLSFTAEHGPGFFYLDGTSILNRRAGLEVDAAQITGKAGGNPLPQDWDELVYKDLGYVTNTRTPLTGWAPKPTTAFNLIVSNPISTTNGSSIVSVNTTVAHGFATGDNIALGNTAIPVPAIGGISSRALTGGHIITVTSSTTFTFQAFNTATNTGITAAVATSTVTAAGGSVRVINRNHWRDAWLEQSVATILASKRRRQEPARQPEGGSKHLRRMSPRKEDFRAARSLYGRDIQCSGAQETAGVLFTSANATEHVMISPAQDEAERQAAFRRVSTMIQSELASGKLCVSADGHLMVASSGAHIVKLVSLDQEKISDKVHKEE